MQHNAGSSSQHNVIVQVPVRSPTKAWQAADGKQHHPYIASRLNTIAQPTKASPANSITVTVASIRNHTPQQHLRSHRTNQLHPHFGTMATKKPRCTFSECKRFTSLSGECTRCQSKFCSTHRLLEDHSCTALAEVKQEDKARNKAKLEGERTSPNKNII